MLERAKTVRAEIEREAETKRNAIAAIFGSDAQPSGKSPRTKQAST